MAYPMTLPVGSLLYFNDTIKLSEHNRRPITISNLRIETTQRMANGSLRKIHIADKKTISVNWEMLPSSYLYTIDAGYGALDLKNFYEGIASKASGAISGTNTFDVTIKYGNGGTEEKRTYIFTDCSFDIVKRNVRLSTSGTPHEFWNVSLTMEEV